MIIDNPVYDYLCVNAEQEFRQRKMAEAYEAEVHAHAQKLEEVHEWLEETE